MARTGQDEFSGQTDTADNNIIKISADGQNTLDVPDNGFVADAQMSRDGQDLVLESPNGETLVVEGYFTADPAPTIEAPDGSVLTGSLVDSFLQSPAQYAQASSMSDESPVGAVEEASGDATVIRTDGTSEPITLGTPIYQGDVIETSADGAVNIVFIDETSMAVSENARLAVDEYQFDPSTESGETNLSVLRGVFVFTSGLIGRDDPDDVQIDTPVGSIGIRGTIIAGKINPGGESEITVVEGAIVVKNGSMEKTLSQQYESVKLYGFNDNIQEMGVKTAVNVSKTYGSVGDVVPKLFSSINDAAKEENTAKETAQKEAAQKAAAQKAAEEQRAEDEAAEELRAEEKTVEEQPVEKQVEQPQHDLLTEKPGFDNHKMNHRDNPEDYKENHTGKRSHHNRHHDQQDKTNHDDTRYIDDTTTNQLSFNVIRSPVHEHSSAGDIVAKIVGYNVPAGTLFTFVNSSTTSADGHYTLTQTGNVTDVVLTSAGAAQTALAAIGTSIGDFTVHATLPSGHILPWNFSGAVHDDAVNIVEANSQDGRVSDGIALTQNNEIGDINNDGVIDTLTGNPNENSGAGEVSLNGMTPSTGATSGDQYGYAVAGIGDFDGDGKSDYAIGAPGVDNGGTDRGKAYLELSGGNNISVAGHADNIELGKNISGIGDINGDGLSDVMIAGNETHHEAYVVFGGAGTNLSSGTLLGGSGFTIATPNDIVAGGSAGDVNGDGFDDFAISLNDGTHVNTYVVYGDGSLEDLTMVDLENPDKALKIHHADAGGSGDYNVTAVGDINGDGFDDVQVGLVGGNQFVVHGGLDSDSPYVMDNAPNDADPNAGKIKASANGQALVGDTHFSDGDGSGFTGLSMRGGNGDNHFTVNNENFKNIDGGNGTKDTIRVNNDVDFSAINFEQISQIERLQVGDDNTKITLTAENIFNLLKSSDTGKLIIEDRDHGDSTGRALEINATSTTGGTVNNVVAALNEEGSGATNTGSTAMGGNNYDHYQIGSYDLYIDQSLATTVV